ncbi:hypothetical protein [Bacillus phage vB_BanS-Thrax2]|nr:hypothetical protein [Bacillus phage vB_BanS-Thrax2]
MTNQKQTLRLIDFHNRNISVLMKSGTVIPDVQVTGTEATDGKGNLLPSPLILGTDRWNNEHSIATDYIEEIAFLDTPEQAQLKSAIWLIKSYADFPNVDDFPLIKESYNNAINLKEELEAKGVELYVPVREDV